MSAPDHLDFYAIVLFLHVTAAVIAFGVTFAFPIVDAVLRRGEPRSLPAWNEAQNAIGNKIITPGAIVVLLTGIYMAIDRWDSFGGVWFSAAGVIIVILLGLGHGFFAPTARKMAAQARIDLQSGAAETGRMSTEYEAMAKRTAMVGMLSSLLVLVALFLMVVKPGA